MRFVHIADLHIGRSIGEIDLYDDQRYALGAIVERVRAARPDAVLIAGDVYDRPQPSARAVELADDFFTSLVDACDTVCVIGGNHDSGERLSFGRRILSTRGLHIAGCYGGKLESVPCVDGTIWLMPFFRPREAAAAMELSEAPTFDGAVRAALAREAIDANRVNVLLMHQFVSSAMPPEICDSEMALSAVGGIECVNVDALNAFDYVALGHLHCPQRIGSERVRYAGSLLKYSASEARHIKSLVTGEVTRDGLRLEWPAIPCLRDLRAITGRLDALTRSDVVAAGNPNDLIHVTLTDEAMPPEALARLRQHYPNVFRLEYRPPATDRPVPSARRERTAPELFREFYRFRNGTDMDDAMLRYMDGVFEDAGTEGAR